MSFNSSLKNHVIANVFTKTAIAARQPKLVNIKCISQFHVLLTIRTGGAAKGVNVPPIEMFTNNTPRVAYLKRKLISLPK